MKFILATLAPQKIPVHAVTCCQGSQVMMAARTYLHSFDKLIKVMHQSQGNLVTITKRKTLPAHFELRKLISLVKLHKKLTLGGPVPMSLIL